MIVYRLVCSSGHEFEGWFKNSAMFDEQASKHVLDCPVCGDTDVRKAIMAPAVAKTTEQVTATSAQNTQPDHSKIRQFMAGYRKFIEANAEYVGTKFPEEARKIHYGETEERHIYGESTLKQARELVQEGIEIAPVPPDPEDLN
ncbi:MAG TPA: DUF1178 family protein [Micropepsaceae bacterium]|nr:DUF1178 family protein [Micropepsaceae bacterium]